MAKLVSKVGQRPISAILVPQEVTVVFFSRRLVTLFFREQCPEKLVNVGRSGNISGPGRGGEEPLFDREEPEALWNWINFNPFFTPYNFFGIWPISISQRVALFDRIDPVPFPAPRNDPEDPVNRPNPSHCSVQKSNFSPIHFWEPQIGRPSPTNGSSATRSSPCEFPISPPRFSEKSYQGSHFPQEKFSSMNMHVNGSCENCSLPPPIIVCP